MFDTLGPRVLQCVSPTGLEGQIILTIQATGRVPLVIAGEEVGTSHTGKILIRSTWFSKDIQVEAEDDVQLVFRLLWFADIYTQKICRENGYELYKIIPGDIRPVVADREAPFGIYG